MERNLSSSTVVCAHWQWPARFRPRSGDADDGRQSFALTDGTMILALDLVLGNSGDERERLPITIETALVRVL